MRFLARVFAASTMLGSLAGLAGAQTPASKPVAAKPQTQAKSSATKKTHHRRKTKNGAWKRHGQQGIQPARVHEIQEALVREKYLAGEPSGVWDARTQEAMSRYQSANGWQSKVTPDSRALIKLGLGPNYSDKELQLGPKPPTDAVTANGTPANGSKQ